jgi:single-strand DNA-binding protein
LYRRPAARIRSAEINQSITAPPLRGKNRKTMYALQNKVQLIGRLGALPDIRTAQNGKKYARFSLATNESYRNAKGERVTETQWHNLVVWGKLAEIAEKYLQKASEVVVQGKLVTKVYTDKEGVRKQFTEVQVSELLMVGEKSGT